MLSSDINVGGFSFKWFLFENLKGLSKKRNDLSRFDRVDNRFGVYIFFDESGSAHYVGLCGKEHDQAQYMKKRIGQYFKNSHDQGNTFAERWMQKNGKSYEDFKLYTANCRLGTLATDSTTVNAQQNQELLGDTGVLGDMERFLIYTLTPAYNVPIYRLTDNEEDLFDYFIKAKIRAVVR